LLEIVSPICDRPRFSCLSGFVTRVSKAASEFLQVFPAPDQSNIPIWQLSKHEAPRLVGETSHPTGHSNLQATESGTLPTHEHSPFAASLGRHPFSKAQSNLVAALKKVLWTCHTHHCEITNQRIRQPRHPPVLHGRLAATHHHLRETVAMSTFNPCSVWAYSSGDRIPHIAQDRQRRGGNQIRDARLDWAALQDWCRQSCWTVLLCFEMRPYCP
jgi:hypothetical protein